MQTNECNAPAESPWHACAQCNASRQQLTPCTMRSHQNGGSSALSCVGRMGRTPRHDRHSRCKAHCLFRNDQRCSLPPVERASVDMEARVAGCGHGLQRSLHCVRQRALAVGVDARAHARCSRRMASVPTVGVPRKRVDARGVCAVDAAVVLGGIPLDKWVLRACRRPASTG